MRKEPSRAQKAVRNSSISLLAQLISIVCSFILPRLILTRFGSSYNGITSLITQFIECVILLRAGVGGVTRAALYKPLAEGDMTKVNGIVNATQSFMRKVSFIFAGGLIVFAFVYPFAVIDEFGWLFSFTLVLILGISTFVQNYFGITYQILIEADQNNYVNTLISIVTTVLNTGIAALLILSGSGIHIVKLGSALIFSLNPIALFIYTRKKYKLDASVPTNNHAIKQRWDAFAQQVAAFVTNNTDIVILTVFTDLRVVSVYTVYYIIANRLRSLVQTLTNGIDAAFGNMMVKGEENNLQDNFRIYEQLIFMISTFAFGCVMILIEPFVMVYTSGVTDVNYSRVAFGMLVGFNQFLYCIRLPYQMLANAAGHFKQTRNGAIFEAIMNLVISVALVVKFGLIGVTIGTLLALGFRTFQYAIYSSRHILKRSLWLMVQQLLVSILEGGLAYLVICLIRNFIWNTPINDYLNWLILAIITAITLGGNVILISFIFYRKQTVRLLKKLLSTIKH